MKKQFAPKNSTLTEIIQGILSGKYYTNAVSAYRAHGFEEMTVDISAAEFDINIRHCIQTVDIPNNKRGNLSAYAGKTVDVIVMNVSRGGPRIEFVIRESK